MEGPGIRLIVKPGEGCFIFNKDSTYFWELHSEGGGAAKRIQSSKTGLWMPFWEMLKKRWGELNLKQLVE
jgi:hypothetical protein